MQRFGRSATNVLAVMAFALTIIGGCGGGGGGETAPREPVPGTPVFLREGLDDRIVTHIYQHAERLFATTDDGLYGKPIGRDDWMPLGLEGRFVQDLAIIDDEHWLAAVFAGGANRFLDPRLFETVNGGSNWMEVANDFGGGASQTEGMFALLYDVPSGRLYATGTAALASSDDLGRTWRLLSGGWDTVSGPHEALALNPATQEIWYGGQNAIEELVLHRYDLATMRTETYSRLMPSPSVVKGITFDERNGDRLLVSGEGGILQSLDNGDTWTNLLPDVDSRFYFQTAMDPQDSRIIYTAGWTKLFDEPQPLILEISRDSGASWEQHQLDDPALFGGAWSIRAVTENGRTVIYVGLYRGGIVKVRFQ